MGECLLRRRKQTCWKKYSVLSQQVESWVYTGGADSYGTGGYQYWCASLPYPASATIWQQLTEEEAKAKTSGYIRHQAFDYQCCQIAYWDYIGSTLQLHYSARYNKATSTVKSKGTYIEDVYSSESNTYPDNGISGDYWYVKQ